MKRYTTAEILGYWSAYDDKIVYCRANDVDEEDQAAIAEARKQGAAEEREAMLVALANIRATGVYPEGLALAISTIMSRVAAEPISELIEPYHNPEAERRCTCGQDQYVKPNHTTWCPCYKKEPKCTCEPWHKRPIPGHHPQCSQITGGFDCDCGYEPKPPKKGWKNPSDSKECNNCPPERKPLVRIDSDSTQWNSEQKGIVNALVDRVKEIENDLRRGGG